MPGIGARPVFLVSVGIGVTGHVQPVTTPAFTEVGRLQQLVYQLGVGIRRLILDESFHALRRGRQTEKVVMEAFGQSATIGRRGRLEIELVKAGQYVSIDWI